MARIPALSLSLSFFSLLSLALPASATCVAPVVGGDSAPAINQALQNAGLGGTVYLCADAIYKIKTAVGFKHPNQTLVTETYDTGSPQGARAWIDIDDPSLATAVSAHDVPGAWLMSVAVSGSEELFGHHSGNQAVIDFGGWYTTYAGRSQKVHGCYITEPRGAASVRVSAGSGAGCNGVVVSNNDIGPSGRDNGLWADGIQYQCRNGFVTGNFIYDATDVGIALFGSPGTLIADNQIVAVSRTLLCGISLSDTGPFKTPAGDGDSRGTRVYNNTIYAQSAWIKEGIASGPNMAWPPPLCDDPVRNDGATIDYNTVKGAYVGYAFPVDGVRNWTITNNTDISQHPFPSYLPTSACYGPVDLPRRFQKFSARSSGTFTGNNYSFVEAVLDGASSFQP
ncbi:MAG TPA: right-handed parallel beta-helix repeat-containing protein [Thermoanaerobaculia bacterium]|nr:right-handed parallel beta-helix repeat-containing protein [Thermoanaerobaculia bacterium]